MELDKALSIAASGMDAQTTRLRVIAENLANQDTTGAKPGADPTGARPSPLKTGWISSSEPRQCG